MVVLAIDSHSIEITENVHESIVNNNNSPTLKSRKLLPVPIRCGNLRVMPAPVYCLKEVDRRIVINFYN